MKKTFNLLKDNQGVVLIEFAFILPILLLLTFPMIDYARYVLLQQKLIKTAYVIGDAITMSRAVEVDTEVGDVVADATYLTELLFDNPNGKSLIDAVPQLMLPFREPTGKNYWQVVITMVRKPDPATGETAGPPEIKWQYDEDSRSFNSGSVASNIGVVAAFNTNTPATLPTELMNTMGDGEEIIVVEVTGKHKAITPVLSALNIPFVSDDTLNYTSYMRARYGSLQYIWQINCPPTSTNCPDPNWP